MSCRGPLLQSLDLPDDRREPRETALLGRGPAFARDAERRSDPAGDAGERDPALGDTLPRDQRGGARRQIVEPALLEEPVGVSPGNSRWTSAAPSVRSAAIGTR